MAQRSIQLGDVASSHPSSMQIEIKPLYSVPLGKRQNNQEFLKVDLGVGRLELGSFSCGASNYSPT